MKKKGWFLLFLTVVLGMSVFMQTIYPVPAESVSDPTEICFVLQTSDDSEVWQESASIGIYSDMDGGAGVSGTIRQDGSTVWFLPETELDETASYSYRVSMEGYEEAAGSFYGDETEINVLLNVVQEKVERIPVSMTYGDDPVDLGEYILLSEDAEISFEILSGSDVVVLQDRKVTAIKSGNAVIRANILTSDGEEKEAEFEISVEKKDLGTLKEADLAFDTVKTEYDGQKSCPVAGRVTSSLLEEGDTLSVSAEAVTECADAGEYEAEIHDCQLEDNEKYTADFSSGNWTTEVTILPLSVALSFSDINVSYGSKEWEKLREGDSSFLPAMENAEIQLDTELPEKLTEEAIESAVDQIVYSLDESLFPDSSYPVGTYEHAVHISFEEGENANFVFQTESSPGMEITPETTGDSNTLWENLEISSLSENGAYTDGEKIYLGADGSVTFQVKEEVQDKYDSVAIQIGNGYTDTVDGNVEGNPVEGTFYLYNSRYPGTRTDADPDVPGMQDNEIPSDIFFMDTEAPEISVDGSILSPLADETAEDIAFSIYMQEDSVLGGSVEDGCSGIKEVSYVFLKYDSENPDNGEALTKRMEKLSVLEWKDQKEFDLSGIQEDGKYILLIRAEDNTGNMLYGAVGIIRDSSAPVIQLNVGNGSGTYNTDVPFDFTVTEPGDICSGIRTVTYVVVNDGSVTQTGTYNYAGQTEAVDSMNGSGVISSDQNDGSQVVLRITVSDQAGNTSSEEKYLMIDMDAPRIVVEYDKTTSNGFYAGSRIAVISVYEKNFDPSRFDLGLKTENGSTVDVGEWNIAADLGKNKDAVSTLTVTFTADDTYSLSPSVTDPAGNRGTVENPETFTIDQTSPVIEISYSDQTPLNGRYYNKERTAFITVIDSNFDPDSFSLQVYASRDGNMITAPGISGWSSNGAVHTAEICFKEDGDYSFTCRAEDLAGNESETVHIGNFTIDCTPPEIWFSGVEDQNAYNGLVSPSVSYTDRNAGTQDLLVTLTGKRHSAKILTGTFAELLDGGTICFPDFAKVPSEDDIYTLTAVYTDLAGNRSEKSITFSINRFGSNFTFNQKTDLLLSQYYAKAGEDLVIYETNVDSLVKKAVTLGINGTARTLVEGEDYSVIESEADGWKVFSYTVYAENFEEEGLYEIRITSTDQAGNVQDNQLKESPICMVIDHTPPEIIITGVEDNGIYTGQKKEALIQLLDNYALEKAEIYLDGEMVMELSREEIESREGYITLELEADNDWQCIQIKVFDAAGNETDSDSMRVLVVSSRIIRWLYTKLFRIIAAGFLFLILFLVAVRRGKQIRK